MTQEDKQLLFQDLCARLPYGVIVHLEYDENTSVTRELGIGSLHDIMVGNAKGIPYLRPMSSMTEEENKEYAKVIVKSQDCSLENSESATTMVNDWLLSKGFDVRGLISKGLAIEVTKENNPYEN